MAADLGFSPNQLIIAAPEILSFGKLEYVFIIYKMRNEMELNE